jgi:hypothetical protein
MKTLFFTTIGILVSDQKYDISKFNLENFVAVNLQDGMIWLNKNYIIYLKEVSNEEFEKMKIMINRKIEVPDMKGRFN